MDIKSVFKQKKVINIGITTAALIGVLVVMGVGFNGATHASTVGDNSYLDEKKSLIAQGIIETNQVNINSKIPGRIIKVYVEEGKEIKKGEALIEVSSEELQAKKKQAEAVVAQAEAGLKAAKELKEQAEAGIDAAKGLVKQAQAGVEAAEGKVKEASAGVKASEKQYEVAETVKQKADSGARTQEVIKAQTAYDLMKETCDRVTILEEKGAVSKQKLDEVRAQLKIAEETLSMAQEGARIEDKKAATATSEQAAAGVEASKTRVDQAEAGLIAARAQLTQAMAGVDSANALLLQAEAGIEAKQALVNQAQGALAEVQAYLNEVIIKSPIDGRVTTLTAKEGELVSTGTQMAIVSNLQDTWVQVSVKEIDLAKVHEGQSVVIKVPAYKEQIFKGTVSTINAEPNFAVKRATTENGDFDIVAFGVKIVLDNLQEVLRPGMSAFVEFTEVQ